MSTITNKAVVREFEELADGGGDLNRLGALCDANMVNHALASGRPQGVEGTRQFLELARRITHPARWLSSCMVAENDLVVHFGVREHEWPGGPFRGFDLAPGRYTREVMFAYRLVEGRIVERWAIRDDLAMIVQLGNATPNT
jgi:predicted ester cyclase